MKQLLILLLLAGQLQAQDECNPDLIAPTFSVPVYPDTIYPSIDNCPSYEDVFDLTYATLEDNCLSPDVAPWYGPTMISSPNWDVTDTSVTHRFNAYDDTPNYAGYQYVTFYFYPIGLSIPEQDDNRLEGSYEVFNLNGQKVTEPLERGIYIRKYENRVEKIFVN